MARRRDDGSGSARTGSVTTRSVVDWPRIYSGVALTAFATLVLELSLTSVFSRAFGYHCGFLAISVALFGFSAGGLLSYLFRGRSERLFRNLGVLAAAAGVGGITALAVLLSRTGSLDTGVLALVYLVSAVPFVLAGTVVSTVMAETIERIDRVYCFDLLGGALGCVVAAPTMGLLDGPGMVIAAALLYVATSAIWFGLAGWSRGRIAAAIVSLYLAGFLLVSINHSYAMVGIPTPGGEEPNHGGLTGQWRRDVLCPASLAPCAPRPGAKALIINLGSDAPGAHCPVSGGSEVTVIEIDRAEETPAAHGDNLPFNGRTEDLRPRARTVTEDVRSFIRRGKEKYQVIQVSLVNASDTGVARALSETYALTAEALSEYLGRLERMAQWFSARGHPIRRATPCALRCSRPKPSGNAVRRTRGGTLRSSARRLMAGVATSFWCLAGPSPGMRPPVARRRFAPAGWIPFICQVTQAAVRSPSACAAGPRRTSWEPIQATSAW